MARLLSVNVGLPRDITGKRRRSTPAFGRRRFKARAWYAGSTSTATDKETWRATAASTGPSWSIRSIPIAFGRSQLDRNDFTYGQFGENFTVDGLPDQEVCIGDRYRIGGALFEVTQPRVTCYRVGIRMNEPRNGGAAGRARQARLLSARPGGRPSRGRRRDHPGRGGPRAHDRVRDRRAALLARSSARSAGARAANPGTERRLAGSFQALLRRPKAAGQREMPGLPRRPARLRRGRDFARCACRARSARAAT